MPESEKDDQELVRYLLGLLPAEEAERLDELSITDDEVAWRLRAVEIDLIDGYVRGSLASETRERFESYYLASPRRRARIKFAGSFLRAVDRAAPSNSSFRDIARIVAADHHQQAPRATASGLPESHPRQTWKLASAAAVFVLALGALLVQDGRLRGGLTQAKKETEALDHRARELEQQLKDQRAANAEALQQLQRARDTLAALQQQSAADRAPKRSDETARPAGAIAILLLPETRGVGQIATLTLPRDADHVRVELRLESNDFSRYQAGLRDPASNRIVWRSGWIVPRPSGNQASVAVSVPAGMLRPQHYSVELTGQRAADPPEIVASYAFQVLPQ